MRKDNIDKFLLNAILGIVKEDDDTDTKLIMILLSLEDRITQMLGKADTDLANFITDVREGIRPRIVEAVKTCNVYIKDKEMKSFSKEAEEFARKRVDHEMSYTCGMDFTDKQIKWIKDHIYTSVRNAYQSAVDIRDLQEIISDRCQIVSGNKGNRAYRIGSEEPEKDRYLLNKELAMWLSKGNGQMMRENNEKITLTCTYDYSDSSGSRIPYMYIKVRKWEDEEWHEPTYSYCFGDR